jgi:hypothetical protein
MFPDLYRSAPHRGMIYVAMKSLRSIKLLWWNSRTLRPATAASALPPTRSRPRKLRSAQPARGLEGFVNSVHIPRIIEELRLPAFEYSAHQPYACQPSSSPHQQDCRCQAATRSGKPSNRSPLIAKELLS